MSQLTIIWICAFLGALVYFILKARNTVKDAEAAGINFTLADALKKDAVDMALSFVLVFLFLSTGGKGLSIPGLTFDFSTAIGAFFTGAAIAYVGVNYVLGIIPGVGNKGKKHVRKAVDEKTAKADDIIARSSEVA